MPAQHAAQGHVVGAVEVDGEQKGEDEAKNILERFMERLDVGEDVANILVQEFIKEAGGSDIRALVIGTKVVAAMQRTGKPGEFRSNLHRGTDGGRSCR